MNINLKKFTGISGHISMNPVFTAFISAILFFMIASLCVFNIGYSQENQTNATKLGFHSNNIPEYLNESYTNPTAGFHISLPGGWKGVNYQNIAMISPAGMHLMNGNLGPNGDKVLMVIEALNASDFLRHRKDYYEIQKTGCNVLSDKNVTINGIIGQELFWQCSSNNDNKVINYFFGSGKTVIIVGLKGSGSIFDSNLNKFMKSVSTLVIDKPTDIRKIDIP